MPKTKISPPPWTFDPFVGAIYDRRGDFPILHLETQNDPEANANGVLASTAPDLQAALRELVAAVDEVLETGLIVPDLEPELTGARAALARSEGKP